MEKRDTDAFLEEARRRFQEAVDADRDNTDAALDDLKFLSGEQWDPTVQSARLRQGRPCLTINVLPQSVAQVVGDIRINKPGIKVRPAEDGDETVAEIRQGLIRSIEHQSKAQNVYAIAGQAQVACGIGNFRVSLDYASDDVFDRDIVIKSVLNPFAVVWDPMAIDPTGRDAGYCFINDELPRKEFEKAYPDSLGSDLYTKQDEQGWVSRDTIRVTEYWVMKERPVQLAMLNSGQVVEVPKEGAAVLDIAVDGQGRPRVRKSVRRSACMYLITGKEILEGPFELPISRLPVFRVQGWEIPVGDRRVRFGLVRFAKDPQRLKNYDRSVMAESLALAPKQQWLLHGSEDEEYVDDFRQAHKSGDSVLRWEGQVPPQRMEPPAFPVALVQSSQLHSQDIKDVTGIHDASLGAQSNETSGRAIMARDRQGDVATFIYPDNLRDAIGECGRVVNELIPIVYDTARTIRVLGEDESAKLQRINDPTDPNSVNLGSGKYDVVVESGPSYSTKRVEAAESMMAFVQAVPNAAAVAGDLIAKAQDWPMADEIGERMKRAMPPQITAEEGQQQQPDPAQMMQAQMAQQAAALQLAEQQAKTSKAQADAARAEADAAKAQFELAQMNGAVQEMVAAHVAQLLGHPGPLPNDQPAPAEPFPVG